jgi:hypothetical protein
MITPIKDKPFSTSPSPKKKASKAIDIRVKKAAKKTKSPVPEKTSSSIKASQKIASKQASETATKASYAARQRAIALQKAAVSAQKAAFAAQRAHMAQQAAALKKAYTAEKTKKAAKKSAKKKDKF